MTFDETKHPDLRAINALGMHRDFGGCADCRLEEPVNSDALDNHLDDILRGFDRHTWVDMSDEQLTDFRQDLQSDMDDEYPELEAPDIHHIIDDRLAAVAFPFHRVN